MRKNRDQISNSKTNSEKDISNYENKLQRQKSFLPFTSYARNYTFFFIIILFSLVFSTTLFVLLQPHLPSTNLHKHIASPSPTIELDRPQVLATENGIVYIEAEDGRLEAIRESDGSVLWHAQLPLRGLYETPIIQDGLLLILMNDLNKYVLDVLNANNGARLWLYQVPGPGSAMSHSVLSPISMMINDSIVYVSAAYTNIYTLNALRLSNGTLLWKKIFQLPDQLDNPAIVPDWRQHILYLSYNNVGGTQGNHRPLYQTLALRLQTSDGSSIWQNTFDGIGTITNIGNGTAFIDTDSGEYALNTHDGTSRWHYTAPKKIIQHLFVAGTFYLGTQDGTIYAVQAHNGTLLWISNLQLQPNITLTRMHYLNNTLYTYALDDSIRALRTSDGQVQWQKSNRGSGTAQSQQIIDGIEYGLAEFDVPDAKDAHSIDEQIDLYAFRLSDGQELWRHRLYMNQFESSVSMKVVNDLIITTSSYPIYKVATFRRGDGQIAWMHTMSANVVDMQITNNSILYSIFKDNTLVALLPERNAQLWIRHYRKSQQQDLVTSD